MNTLMTKLTELHDFIMATSLTGNAQADIVLAAVAGMTTYFFTLWIRSLLNGRV